MKRTPCTLKFTSKLLQAPLLVVETDAALANREEAKSQLGVIISTRFS